jgi:hypothetical protein
MVAQGANLALHPDQAMEAARMGAEMATWAGRLLLPQMVERTVLQGHPEGSQAHGMGPGRLPPTRGQGDGQGRDATINDLLMTVMSGGCTATSPSATRWSRTSR